MLYYALVFFITSVISAIFGFGGISDATAGIAKVLFYIFLSVFLVTFVLGLADRGRSRLP